MAGFIGLGDAKDHLVIAPDDTHDDALVQRLIDAAARYIETLTGHVAEEREELFVFDGFARAIELRLRPIDPESVEIQYIDPDGNELPFEGFRMAAIAGVTRLTPAIGECWPQTACVPGAVRVTATVGYGATEQEGADDAPAHILHATRLCVGSWYADREVGSIPAAVGLLLGDERLRRV